MNAPKAYHKLLDMVKSFVIFVLSTFHSAGLNLLTRKSTTLTPTYANKMHIHISDERGSIKEKIWAALSAGFFIIMLMPRLRNGFVKSTTRSLSEVIVTGATAMWAFCKYAIS